MNAVDNHVHDADKYFQIAKTMKFGDYLSLIEAGPTDLRLFLFDIFKKQKTIKTDAAVNRKLLRQAFEDSAKGIDELINR